MFTGKIAASAWRGSEQRAARRKDEGLVLFAGQKPYPTWRQALPTPDDSGRDPPAQEREDATSNGVVPKPRRSLVLPIVLGIGFGVVAVGLVGFLVTLTSRPGPAPKTAAAALPALEVARPPLTATSSNPPDQAIGPEERLERLEPPRIQIGVGPRDNSEAASPRDSSPLVELQPSAPGAAPSVVLAPLP
ncbi:MAG TPA: hypothetical protein VIJ63_16900, partial [Roseiarcus sp.]